MKFTAIIQARMGSSRLPGKILMKLEGRSALWHQVNRLKSCLKLNEVVIATTTNPEDQAVVDFADLNGLRVYRGSEADVLDRYYQCALTFGLKEGLVRLTSDCPLIDAEVTDQTIALFESLLPEIDYASNTLERTFPRGLDTEVFTFNALARAHRETTEMAWREHVTPIFYRTQGTFKTANLKSSTDLSHLRLTLDTPEDLTLIQEIYRQLYKPTGPLFGLKEIVDLFERNPTLIDINREISQKELK